MSADIDSRFDYHPPSGARIDQHRTIRDDVKCLAETFDETLPAGREKALALTKLEEALFWGNAAIARSETST